MTSTQKVLLTSLFVAVVPACQGPTNGPPVTRDPAPPLYTESTLDDAALSTAALMLMGWTPSGATGESCSECHGITRRLVHTWAEQTQVVLDGCLADRDVTTDAAAAEIVACLHGPSPMYRAANASIFAAAAHLDFFQYVFEHGAGANAQTEHDDFVRWAGMPQEDNPRLSQEDFDILATWFVRGAPRADTLLPNDPPPSTCMPFVSPEVTTHAAMMETMGWSAVNREAGILMHGCAGSSDPTTCLATETRAADTTYGADWDVPNATIRELHTTTYGSSYWTRSSADGRFVAHGPGYMIDLETDTAIPTSAPYDPGFFPDNSAFVWPGVVCEQSLLLSGPAMISLAEPECTHADIGLYEHVGVGLAGGDYWVVTSQFTSDDGGHGPTLSDPDASFSADAHTTFTRLLNTGSGFAAGPMGTVATPFEGDSTISPSSTMVMSRIAGPDGAPLGYDLYRITSAMEGACSGTPTACSARSATDCLSGGGCTMGACGGTPTACHTLTMASTCTAQSGCGWSGVSCSGSARACSTFDGASCGDQDGCTTDAGASCAGTAIACGSLDEATCGDQPGCSWGTGTGSGALSLREIGRYCYPGAKIEFSFDEHYALYHHYILADDAEELGFTGPTDPDFAAYLSQGASNVYLIDLTTGERTRITNMGPGQFALFPHFRSDGWIYFLVRGNTGASGGGERLMATDAMLRIAN
jgi:hypothetical protein